MNAESSPSFSASRGRGLDTVRAAADAWVRRRDAGLSASEQRELRFWLSADPSHAAAYSQADQTRTPLDWPLYSDATDEILAGLETRARKRNKRRRIVATSAVACAVVILALGLVLHEPTPRGDGELHRAASRTLTVVEPRRQTLPDGSTVILKDGAEIHVDFSGSTRVVTLRSGTAHFTVASNPARPFVVQAAGVAVRAVGTAFCVELDPMEVTVVVTEGRVAVNQTGAATPAVLDVGNSVAVPVDPRTPTLPEVLALPETELNQRLAWRIARLEFSGTPLAEVVAMINRHNTQQFVLADRSLEKIVLSGILRADKIEALIEMLTSDFNVRAVREGKTIVLHAARPR